MALESILFGGNMGIFDKLHKHKKGIAAATSLAAAVAGTDVSQAKQYQQAVEMTPAIKKQLNSDGIPEFLADTMFKRIPNAHELIKSFNYDGSVYSTGATMDKISYMMDPTDNTWAQRGVSTGSMDRLQLGMEEINKPEYWVLLKLAYKQVDTNFYATTYGRLRDKISDPGVKHLAFSMYDFIDKQDTTVETELLKALYYGATGSDEGVKPILNNTYVEMPEVQQQVEEWKEKYDYSPFKKEEDNALLAYTTNTLAKNKVKNPYLVSVSFMLLNDYYSEKNNKKNKLFGILENNIEVNNNLPTFSIKKTKNNYIFPFNIFK